MVKMGAGVGVEGEGSGLGPNGDLTVKTEEKRSEGSKSEWTEALLLEHDTQQIEVDRAE